VPYERAPASRISRRRHLLYPTGQVGRLPDGRVVHVQVAADRADDDLARVQPHADLDQHALGPSYGLGVRLDRVPHPERRVAGAHRVVLVGNRRAEERHAPIAHELVHGAFVPVKEHRDPLALPLRVGRVKSPHLLRL
jgi:hypothetical protein